MKPKRKVDWKKLAKLETARADDATKQFNDSQAQLRIHMKMLVNSREANRFNEFAAHLNMEAYESAQLHAKTNHQLLTEARAEIDRLKAAADEYYRIDWQAIKKAVGMSAGLYIPAHIVE